MIYEDPSGHAAEAVIGGELAGLEGLGSFFEGLFTALGRASSGVLTALAILLTPSQIGLDDNEYIGPDGKTYTIPIEPYNFGNESEEDDGSSGVGQEETSPNTGNPNDDENNGKKGKEDEVASEKTAKDMAKQIERDLGKNARRDFHDMKSGGDRTLNELKEDARALYEEAGKTPPSWMR